MNEIKAHNTMSPEEQRIAIAEACGWTGFNPDNIPDCLQFTARRADGKWGLIPDGPNDLNDCHEFEEKLIALGPPALDTYEIFLLAICTRAGNRIFRATAAQRCEAFLKTINKWTYDN